MKYVLLAYTDDSHGHTLTAAEQETLQTACDANGEWLRRSGHLLTTAVVEESNVVITVRADKGEVAVAGGPITAHAETLVSLFLIDARDLNHAIHLAATMPQAQRGPIEVRKVAGQEARSQTSDVRCRTRDAGKITREENSL